MLVEILYFDGCHDQQATRQLVERVAAKLAISPEIRLLEVPDLETAERLRFLGSPTVRVDGKDIEPGADAREQFMLACRVYHTPDGLRGRPHEHWLREALSHS
jgi:hypothetical protein